MLKKVFFHGITKLRRVCNFSVCLIHSGLVMLQTTNSVFNKTLYDYATPKALLAWQRVRLSNWLASDGEKWAFLLSQFNSG